MEIDETEEPEMKYFSNTIIGILAISVVSIFMVVILGVWGYSVFSENNIEPVSIGMPLLAGNNVSENNEFENKNSNATTLRYDNVLVAQYCTGSERDVAPGWVNFCIDIPDPLPICITDCYLESWTMTAYSYGGYHPDDFGATTITLDQIKTGAGGVVDITWTKVGTIGYEDFCCTDWWTYIECEWVCQFEWCEFCLFGICIPYPCFVCDYVCEAHHVCIDAQWCTFDVYEASFSVDRSMGNDAIQLDSNHLPAVTATCGTGCGPELCTCGPDDLDKEVTLILNSDWAGCGEQDQCFEII